jgi:protein TonB
MASLVLHGLVTAAVLGLLAMPHLAPPPPDQGVEILWEQVPAEESMASAEEAQPPMPPAVPPPTEATAPPPPPAVPPPPAPAPPAVAAPAPPPPQLFAEVPATQPDALTLPPSPPMPSPPETAPAEAPATAEAGPPPEPQEEPLPLPAPPTPTPPPRQQAQPQPAPPPRQPAPQEQAETRRKATDGAENLPPVSQAVGSARVTGATAPPQPDYRPPQPAFPEGARQRGETGTVRVRLYVDAAGQVARVEITQSSGFRELDNATESYFRKWRFRPALRNGQPVAEQVTTAMTWRLNGYAANRPW